MNHRITMYNLRTHAEPGRFFRLIYLPIPSEHVTLIRLFTDGMQNGHLYSDVHEYLNNVPKFLFVF